MLDKTTYDQWLEGDFWPLMGADGEDDPEDTATGGESETEEEAPATGGDADSEDDPNTDDEEETEPEDEAERLKTESERLRSELASAQVAIRKAKAEARTAREEAAKKGGNWEQVAKEREAELTDAREHEQQLEERAVKAEEELDSFRREVRITRVASKLHFRDPEDAINVLAKRPEDSADDKACERALRKLAESKPYLVDQRRARGRAMNGGAGGDGQHYTKEQLEKMSAAEINAAWERGEIQTSVARIGNR